MDNAEVMFWMQWLKDAAVMVCGPASADDSSLLF